ncbi:unnamed protein product [Rhodiola kirilowii]
MCPVAAKAAHVSSNGSSDEPKSKTSDALLNMEQGDPTMCEPYWAKMGEKGAMAIGGCQSLSYFSANDNNNNLSCWYMEAELIESIKRLHSVVGNAVTKDKFIVVGTGSTHLLHAALYAITAPLAQPVNVVSAAPYYSGYPEIADIVRSGLYKWGGDATTYDKDAKGPYIELICSPNNPDGSIRRGGPLVPNHNYKESSKLVHDFAYLWPQYTPIEAPADHDVMLFTLSKSTGHAGSRVGWAIVKDKSVAERMVHFVITTTIGVSKEAQLRAAKIIGVLVDHCGHDENDFFKYGQLRLKDRWKRLREVVHQSDNVFILKDYESSYCSYFKDTVKPNPAFAWLCSEHISDLAKFFRGLKIRVRGGDAFGVESNYVRVSMVGKDVDFNLFLERLAVAAIKKVHLIAAADAQV